MYNEKIKEYKNILLDMNKNDAINYSFSKYYEFENDNRLANFFFCQIAKLLFGVKETYEKNVDEITDYDKKNIIDAAYKYHYEDIKSLKGPLGNTFWVIFEEEKFELNKIKPYMELTKMIVKAKGRSYK